MAKNKLIISLVCFAFWALILLNIAVKCLPSTPLSIKRIGRLQFLSLFPQGWAFFTRNPREEDVYVYSFKNGQLSAQSVPISSPLNLFGLKRNLRANGIELSDIQQAIGNKIWLNYSGDLSKLSIDSLPIFNVKNKYAIPTILDTIVLVKQEPVPFVWSYNKKSKMNMKAKIAILNVYK